MEPPGNGLRPMRTGHRCPTLVPRGRDRFESHPGAFGTPAQRGRSSSLGTNRGTNFDAGPSAALRRRFAYLAGFSRARRATTLPSVRVGVGMGPFFVSGRAEVPPSLIAAALAVAAIQAAIKYWYVSIAVAVTLGSVEQNRAWCARIAPELFAAGPGPTLTSSGSCSRFDGLRSGGGSHRQRHHLESGETSTWMPSSTTVSIWR